MRPASRLTFVAALLLAACASTPAGVPPLLAGRESGIVAAQFWDVHGAPGLHDLWRAAFGRLASPPPEPDVDFGRQMVLGVFLGRESRSGFGIQVTGVRELADTVQVDVLFTAPGPGCLTAQVITQPYAIYALPASPKPLRYAVRHVVKYC